MLMGRLSERLRFLREQRGLSQYKVAKDLNIPRTTYANWEQGKAEPDAQTLQRIADYFGVSIDFLFGYESKSITQEPWMINLRPIPVYNGARAGLHGSFIDENIVRWVTIPVNKPGKFGVIVHGDSMEPTICDGDIVVVDPDLSVENGSLALVLLDDEVYAKKIYFNDNSVILQSLNPAYPPLIVSKHKFKLYLIGKIVMIIKECV